MFRFARMFSALGTVKSAWIVNLLLLAGVVGLVVFAIYRPKEEQAPQFRISWLTQVNPWLSHVTRIQSADTDCARQWRFTSPGCSSPVVGSTNSPRLEWWMNPMPRASAGSPGHRLRV